jgi:DNA-binding CsgD family transcriptional regulator
MNSRNTEQIVNLAGVDQVRERLQELTAATRAECVSLHPGPTQTPDAKTASRPLNQLLLERGVAVRGVYQESYRYSPDLQEYANWFIGLGGELRTAPTVPMLLIVFDRQVAILPIDPADTRRGAQEVRSPGMVAAAYGLFAQIWGGATATDGTAERDDAGLDPQLRELVRLLATGSTDEMVARKLSVSLRTVKRRSAELMDLLNARSRFEAGALAAQRGWIEPAGRRSRLAEAALDGQPRANDGARVAAASIPAAG